MLSDFAQVFVFLLLAILFVFGALFAGRFVRPRNPSYIKSQTYECGEVAKGGAWINFNMRFYVIALIFMIFDVEAALIFPVAAVFKKWVMAGMGHVAFFEIFIFVLILFVGLIYVWKKGDLDWIRGQTADHGPQTTD